MVQCLGWGSIAWNSPREWSYHQTPRPAFLKLLTPLNIFLDLQEPLLKYIHWENRPLRWGSVEMPSLQWLSECHPYKQLIRRYAAGSAKWCWTQIYEGTWWEVNLPQLKEPLATSAGTLRFHGNMVENGWPRHLILWQPVMRSQSSKVLYVLCDFWV